MLTPYFFATCSTLGGILVKLDNSLEQIKWEYLPIDNHLSPLIRIVWLRVSNQDWY